MRVSALGLRILRGCYSRRLLHRRRALLLCGDERARARARAGLQVTIKAIRSFTVVQDGGLMTPVYAGIRASFRPCV